MVAVEDVVQLTLVELAGFRGRRQVTVLPFVGHGTPDLVHVRARVVLGSKAARDAATTVVVSDDPTDPADTADRGDAPDGDPPGTSGAGDGAAVGEVAGDGPVAGAGGARRSVRRSAAARLGTWGTLRESLTPFFTVELPRIRVTVRMPAGATVARCDRQGYLDVAIAGAGLTPGWQELTVAASRRGFSTETPVPVLIVDPEATLAVISDLDDTVIETGLTRGLEVLRLTLLTSVTDRTPLPGAAELYRALTAPRAGAAGCPVFYLSTSPWNLYELLARFMVLRGFPTGPLMLTDWGPSRTNWLRVTAEEHKLRMIRTLLTEHPAMRVVLIGDTGQLDPEIYATVAVESPDRVRAVYVRRTPFISAARAVEVDALARRASAAGVPMVAVEDSVDIARHAAGLGLLDAADVRAVTAATRR